MKGVLAILLASVLASSVYSLEPMADGFEYSLSVSVLPRRTAGGCTDPWQIQISAASPKRVPGDSPAKYVFFQISQSPGEIIATSKEEMSSTGMPMYPPDKPAQSFRFELKDLEFAFDGTVRLTIRFKDSDEVYLLRYIDGGGLSTTKVSGKYGQAEGQGITEFVLKETSDGSTIYRCDPFGVTAWTDGKPMWRTNVEMLGAPSEIRVVGETVFVRTSCGDSFYLLKDSGELVLHVHMHLEGEDPRREVRELWQGSKVRVPDRKPQGFGRYIHASVLLNDRLAIPLLIECVEDGMGLEEKCAAVVALQKFYGETDTWLPPGRKPTSYFMRRIGMNTVFPKQNALAEQAKWQAIYDDEQSRRRWRIVVILAAGVMFVIAIARLFRRRTSCPGHTPLLPV